MVIVEIIRTYIGYVGNLSEKVTDLLYCDIIFCI